MIVVVGLLLFAALVRAQETSFCNVRCDIDYQCGGECNRCVTTNDDGRFCRGLSECGDRCNRDSDCGDLCNRCINGACSGLPCHADCEKSAVCGDECSACLRVHSTTIAPFALKCAVHRASRRSVALIRVRFAPTTASAPRTPRSRPALWPESPQCASPRSVFRSVFGIVIFALSFGWTQFAVLSNRTTMIRLLLFLLS
jgi:hypothetical protein